MTLACGQLLSLSGLWALGREGSCLSSSLPSTEHRTGHGKYWANQWVDGDWKGSQVVLTNARNVRLPDDPVSRAADDLLAQTRLVDFKDLGEVTKWDGFPVSSLFFCLSLVNLSLHYACPLDLLGSLKTGPISWNFSNQTKTPISSSSRQGWSVVGWQWGCNKAWQEESIVLCTLYNKNKCSLNGESYQEWIHREPGREWKESKSQRMGDVQ